MDSTEDTGLKKVGLWRLTLAFLCLLYICFLALDLFAQKFSFISDYIKIICIVILFLVQLYYGGDTDRLWVAAAFITVVADVFLLFTPYYLPGVLIFCFAHLARLQQLCPSWVKKALLLALPGITGRIFLPALLCAGICYAVLLLMNAFCAFNLKKRELSLAYMLFIFCDISVLLTNFASAELSAFARPAMWLFYLPSQILLADAMIRVKNEAKNG